MLVVVVLPAAAHASSRGGVPHPLVADGTPLGLASVALGQHDRDLVLTLRTDRRVDRSPLSTGAGRICLTATQDHAHTLCVNRRAGAWHVVARGQPVAGEVSNPSLRTLLVRVRPADIGLAPGPLRWSVTATPMRCQAPVTSPAPPTAGGAPSASTADAACRSRAPRPAGTTYAGRVWRAVPRGCSPSGAAQVTSGPRGRRIALTYDDGPSTYTPALLAILRRLAVPATFFLVGQEDAARPAIARQILAEGHEIGDHSWNHANLGGGGPGASSQLQRTNAVIRRATGYTPCLFRPPYGATGADLVERTRSLEMTSVLWSADPFDWKTPGTDAIVSRVLAQTHAGAIILEHDGGGPRAQTLAAAPLIIAALRARGYTFVTVSQLLGYTDRFALLK